MPFTPLLLILTAAFGWRFFLGNRKKKAPQKGSWKRVSSCVSSVVPL